MVVTCPNVKSVMLDVRSQSLDQYHTSTVIIVKTETWDYVTCDHGFQLLPQMSTLSAKIRKNSGESQCELILPSLPV